MKENNYYVIYCTNNCHDLYMDYRGEAESFDSATKFRDELSAHEFLRGHNTNDYYHWAVMHIDDVIVELTHKNKNEK